MVIDLPGQAAVSISGGVSCIQAKVEDDQQRREAQAIDLAVDQRRPCCRDRHAVRTAGRSGFKQQHPILRIFRQPRRDNTM